MFITGVTSCLRRAHVSFVHDPWKECANGKGLSGSSWISVNTCPRKSHDTHVDYYYLFIYLF